MTNRKNIVAVDCETSFADAYRFMLDQSFSRFPLYEGDIDNIIGILNIKDMARLYISGEYEGKTLKDIARKPNFVPETQNIDVLFNDMKKSKNHMAVVIDEYGQTAGIVAFEDVLEEIVGNIMDEYDVDEKFIVKQANGAFLMRGLSSLEDVEQAIGLEIDEEYLAMSRARREEIEHADIRADYVSRLAKSGSILPPDDLFVHEADLNYGKIPWLEE